MFWTFHVWSRILANMNESSLLFPQELFMSCWRKHDQKITTHTFRFSFQNFALPCCFPDILSSYYHCSPLSSGWVVDAACGSFSPALVFLFLYKNVNWCTLLEKSCPTPKLWHFLCILLVSGVSPRQYCEEVLASRWILPALIHYGFDVYFQTVNIGQNKIPSDMEVRTVSHWSKM